MKPIKPSNATLQPSPANSEGGKPLSVSGVKSIGAVLIAVWVIAGTFRLSAAMIYVPGDQPTITAALAAAASSDQILIASGTYAEAAMLNVNKSVTLTASGGPVTINVPTSANSVASVSAAGVVFSGIKFERLTANNEWMRSVEMGSGSATFTNCTFTGPGNGVGVVLFSGADATFDNCAFSNFNATASWAAAILMQNQGAGYSDVIVRNSTFDTGCNGWIKAFDNNTSWPKVGELTVSNCTFRAARHLQALKFRDGGASAMQYDSTKALLFQDCTFEGTTLEMVEFHYTNGSRPTSLKFSRCQFKAYNSTRKIFWLDLPTPIVFEDCLFAGGQHETIMTVWGGPPSVNFYHCTMINDGTASQSTFINGWDGGRTFNIVNCLFRSPANYTAGFVGDAGSSANRNYAVSYSVIDHATPVGAKAQITPGVGYSNTSLASAFANAAARNFHLVNGTPWVDGGTNLGYLFDLDHNARNHGSAPDMGAYEFNRPPEAVAISMGAQSGVPAMLKIIGGKFPPTDADNDTMSVSAVSSPTSNGGQVTTDGVNVIYTAASSYVGSDSFTYTVNDGHGGTVTATITVTVSANGEGFNRLSPPSPIANGTVVLSYLGIPGTNYALDWATNLTAPVNWMPVATNSAGANGILNFTNTSSEPVNFFRTRYVP